MDSWLAVITPQRPKKKKMQKNKKQKLTTPEGRDAFKAEASEQVKAANSLAVALFKSQTESDKEFEQLMSGAVRRNLPMLIKPGDVPVGGFVRGEIVKIVNSPVSTIKGLLLWLRNSEGIEFVFPCTGVIRSALAPGIEDKEELRAALEKEVGNSLIARRQPSKQSDKYKKEMFMFDVFTVPANK